MSSRNLRPLARDKGVEKAAGVASSKRGQRHNHFKESFKGSARRKRGRSHETGTNGKTKSAGSHKNSSKSEPDHDRDDSLARSSSPPVAASSRLKSPAKFLVEPQGSISFTPQAGEVEDEDLTPQTDRPGNPQAVSNQGGMDFEPAMEPAEDNPEDLMNHISEGDERDDDEESDGFPQPIASDSAPTQIIVVADGFTQDSSSIIQEAIPEVQMSAQKIHASDDQQKEDIAGLNLSRHGEEIGHYPSPKDVFSELDTMAGSVAKARLPGLRESIIPYLMPFPSYSQALLQIPSAVNDPLKLPRMYVNTWIFLSLTLSRVDGLRLTYAISLSFRLCHIDETSFFISDLAKLVGKFWFTDASNMLFREPKGPSLNTRSGVRTGLRTGANSSNSSKAQAVISGPNQGERQGQPATNKSVEFGSGNPLLMLRRPTSIDQVLVSLYSDSESYPSVPSVSMPPRALQKGISTPPEEDLSDADTSVETKHPAPGESLDRRLQIPIQASNERDLSNKREINRTVSDSPTNEPSAPRCLRCARDAFTNKVERDNHMKAWHLDVDDKDHAKRDLLEQQDPLCPDYAELREVDARSDRFPPVDLADSQQTLVGGDFLCYEEKEASKFFVVGRVLAVLWQGRPKPWSDIGIGKSDTVSSDVSAKKQTELFYSPVRRFLIVLANQGFCWAVPIFTHSERTLDSRNAPEGETRRRKAIYDSGKLPSRTHENARLANEAIAVEMEAGQTLEDSSQLESDQLERIDWTIKAKNLGAIKDDEKFHNYLRYLGVGPPDRREEREQDMEKNLAGGRAAKILRGRELGTNVMPRPTTTWPL